jgi:hypothetical protein
MDVLTVARVEKLHKIKLKSCFNLSSVCGYFGKREGNEEMSSQHHNNRHLRAPCKHLQVSNK